MKSLLAELKASKIFSLVLLLLIVFSSYLLFRNLGKATLENWDEAWYAEATKQMVRTHNIIVLHWNNRPFFEKPPMYIWLSSLFSLFLGLSEFSVRLTSAISALILLVLVFLFSKKTMGDHTGICRLYNPCS